MKYNFFRKFEEEKIQYLKKLKEKTNFAQLKQNLSNQNETLSESNRLKDFFVEKDNIKPKYIHSIGSFNFQKFINYN